MMGEKQILPGDTFEKAPAITERAPFGMTTEMWVDTSPNSGARRGAHFVLSNYHVYPKLEEAAEEASLLFGATQEAINQHICEVVEMEKAK